MKKIIINCDICEKEIAGNLSVYIFNAITMGSNGQMAPIKKEEYYCETCTANLVYQLNKLKDDQTRGTNS